MARQKHRKSRNKKRSIKSPTVAGPMAPSKTPVTEAWRGRMMQGVVRRSEANREEARDEKPRQQNGD